jgi:hypothetical protein
VKGRLTSLVAHAGLPSRYVFFSFSTFYVSVIWDATLCSLAKIHDYSMIKLPVVKNVQADVNIKTVSFICSN